MALLDHHGVAGGFLPVLGEGIVELLVELARRIVRDIEQFLFGSAGGNHADQRHRGHEAPEGKEFGRPLHHVLLVKINCRNSTVLVGILKPAA
jgi:hypothetical protein